MPKAWKTHSGAAKRFKITKTWKLKHSKTCKRHLLTNKWRSTKKDTYGRMLRSKKEERKMHTLIIK